MVVIVKIIPYRDIDGRFCSSVYLFCLLFIGICIIVLILNCIFI